MSGELSSGNSFSITPEINSYNGEKFSFGAMSMMILRCLKSCDFGRNNGHKT